MAPRWRVATDFRALALRGRNHEENCHLSVTDAGKNSSISQHVTASNPLKNNEND
jgi:hypothetical protein